MIYFEVQIKFNENGKDVKENILVEDVLLFGDAEQKALSYCAENKQSPDFSVSSIKISKVTEFVNNKPDVEDMPIYKAKLTEKMEDEKTGKLKEVSHHVMVYANDMDEANMLVNGYIEESICDLELSSLSKTNFLEVI